MTKVAQADRVEKYRARKLMAEKGKGEMRFYSWLYQKRSRAKKDLKRLQEELAKTKSEARAVLSDCDLQEMSRSVDRYKEANVRGHPLTSHDIVDAQTKVVKYEINILRTMINSAPARSEMLPPSIDNKATSVPSVCSALSRRSGTVEAKSDAPGRVWKSSNQQRLQRRYTAPLDPELPPLVSVSSSENSFDSMPSDVLHHNGLSDKEETDDLREMIALLAPSVLDVPLVDVSDMFLDEFRGDIDIFDDPQL